MSTKIEKKSAKVEENIGLDVLLHPLVILNIGDHHTRSKAYGHKRAIGVLLGEQKGRKVEIHTSYELMFDIVDGAAKIDPAFLIEKRDQMAQVFPTYEILGWYTTGSDLTEKDRATHQQIMEWNESPLVLLVDCESTNTRDLPVFLFETLFQLTDDAQVVTFGAINYRMESEESERVCVDHITHLEATTGDFVQSKLLKQLSSFRVAITMLQQRIGLIASYLEKVKKGEHEKDHNLLRAILSLCHKLPAMDSEKFNNAYTTEFQDALLIAHLGTLTKGCNVLNELIEKFNFTYERRRYRGYF